MKLREVGNSPVSGTSAKSLKVFWHLGLAALAFYEMTTANTALRRAFLGGCAGWHLGAAYDDAKGKGKDV